MSTARWSQSAGGGFVCSVDKVTTCWMHARKLRFAPFCRFHVIFVCGAYVSRPMDRLHSAKPQMPHEIFTRGERASECDYRAARAYH